MGYRPEKQRWIASRLLHPPPNVSARGLCQIVNGNEIKEMSVAVMPNNFMIFTENIAQFGRVVSGFLNDWTKLKIKIAPLAETSIKSTFTLC